MHDNSTSVGDINNANKPKCRWRLQVGINDASQAKASIPEGRSLNSPQKCSGRVTNVDVPKVTVCYVHMIFIVLLLPCHRSPKPIGAYYQNRTVGPWVFFGTRTQTSQSLRWIDTCSHARLPPHCVHIFPLHKHLLHGITTRNLVYTNEVDNNDNYFQQKCII